MNRVLSRAILALLVCLALAVPSRADLIDWSYSTSPVTPTVTADGVSPVGYLKLTGNPTVSASGSSDIVLASLSAFSTIDPSSPESFTNRTWKVGLTITDSTSNTSATMYFTGQFNGTLSSLSSNIGNTFTGLISDSVVLNGTTYTATVDAYVPPSVPNALNTGAIGVHVDVSGGDTRTTGVPEPSSLMLFGIGAGGCALVGWRRRRQG